MKVKTNSDRDFVKEMRQKIKDANGHCPCVMPSKRNGDTKCMCKEFRDMMERKEEGYCGCGLYYYDPEENLNED